MTHQGQYPLLCFEFPARHGSALNTVAAFFAASEIQPANTLPRRNKFHCQSRTVFFAVLLQFPAEVLAGAPFSTDDAGVVEEGRFEVFGPIIKGNGDGSNLEASIGSELNYGFAPDLQLTIGIPVKLSHEGDRWNAGMGDFELSVKYRIPLDHDESTAIAVAPGVKLPTASNRGGNRKFAAHLSFWLQKDLDPWSAFGGGGYVINPGLGNRDYWTGGVAVTREVSSKTLLGLELNRQGPDAAGARASTSLGIGAIHQLKTPFRILASGGPTFPDGTGKAGYHFFLALGANF